MARIRLRGIQLTDVVHQLLMAQIQLQDTPIIEEAARRALQHLMVQTQLRDTQLIEEAVLLTLRHQRVATVVLHP